MNGQQQQQTSQQQQQQQNEDNSDEVQSQQKRRDLRHYNHTHKPPSACRLLTKLTGRRSDPRKCNLFRCCSGSHFAGSALPCRNGPAKRSWLERRLSQKTQRRSKMRSSFQQHIPGKLFWEMVLNNMCGGDGAGVGMGVGVGGKRSLVRHSLSLTSGSQSR